MAADEVKFKVGDEVRLNEDGREAHLAKLYEKASYQVLGLDCDGDPLFINDAGEKVSEYGKFFELVPTSDTKDTNPKDAVGTSKVPLFSVLPMRVLGGIALALMEGARKYGRHNYRPAGVRASVYMDAVGRHLGSWYEGEDNDPDSGLSHIDKALAGLMVLRDSMLHGNMVDDRPPAVAAGWVSGLNERAKEIIAKYPDAKPAYTQKGAP